MGWSNHCLPKQGRFFFGLFCFVLFFLIKTPSVLYQSGFVFFVFLQKKLSHRDRYQLYINCDFTYTFAVLTEKENFAEFTDLCSQRTLGNHVNIYKYNKWDKSRWFSWQISLFVLCFKCHYDITQSVRIFFL
mgnify:FL=1